jgi:hypothetical protein
MEESLRKVAQRIVEIVETSESSTDETVGRIIRQLAQSDKYSAEEIGKILIRVETLIMCVNEFREVHGIVEI